MPFSRKTPDAEISDYYNRRVDDLRRAILNNLVYVGEAAVTEARERGSYKDQTGNLRSSIGYMVLDHGSVFADGGFEVVKDGQKGANEGQAFLQRLISKYSTGYSLVVVAGMNYAAYVEAKNYNVLDSAEQLTERLLPQLMKGLNL